MTCRICGRSVCTESFHSIEKQEQFANAKFDEKTKSTIAKVYYSEASQVLRSIVLAAIKRQQELKRGDHTTGTEENPARFGNVEFWTADNGDFCYFPHTSAWDTEKLVSDLQYWF